MSCFQLCLANCTTHVTKQVYQLTLYIMQTKTGKMRKTEYEFEQRELNLSQASTKRSRLLQQFCLRRGGPITDFLRGWAVLVEFYFVKSWHE